MPLPQILEVAIGLVVVYYILGAIVSYITKLVTETLESRGLALEKHLKIALGDKFIDLKALPQIRAQRPIRYKNWLSVFTSATEPKSVEKIPASLLVDAVFDITGLSGKSGLDADELTAVIERLPESEARQALLEWIQKGVTDINGLRDRTRDYLSGVLDQAGQTFKSNARSFVIILSLLITLAFGTDSIQLAKDLWNSAELRALASLQAGSIVQSQGAETNVGNMIKNLSSFSIRLGWWQPQNLPQEAPAAGWPAFILLKILGLAVTAIAVSQGSSFWYDILKKITSRPSTAEEAQGGNG